MEPFATYRRIGNRAAQIQKPFDSYIYPYFFSLYSIFAPIWPFWALCPFPISKYIHSLRERMVRQVHWSLILFRCMASGLSKAVLCHRTIAPSKEEIWKLAVANWRWPNTLQFSQWEASNNVLYKERLKIAMCIGLEWSEVIHPFPLLYYWCFF